MKLKTLVAALAGAAALAVPSVAHAATYAPTTQTDPSHDDDANEPSQAGVDIVSVHGSRTKQVFSMSITFRDLKKVDASRRYVGLIDPVTGKGRILEYRITPGGKVQTAYYNYRLMQTGEQINPAKCQGAKVTAKTSADKVAVKLPASCYPGSKKAAGLLVAGSAVWTKQGWTPGPLSEAVFQSPPVESDSAQTLWQWSPQDTRTPGPVPRISLF